MALVQEEGIPHLNTASAVNQQEHNVVKRSSSESLAKEKSDYSNDKPHDLETNQPVEEEEEKPNSFYAKIQPLFPPALALLILGWWISATVLKATRHRWIVQTVFGWGFIAIIAFRYIPTTVVTRPVEAVWGPLVQRPWNSLSYRIRLAIGWLSLIAIVFGSAFGFPLQKGTNYGERAISVLGLVVFQFSFWLTSYKRKEVPWPTVVVGLFLQQAIALFVLKTKAGYDIFRWVATLAADFLNEGQVGAGFFFSAEVVSKHWLFVNTVGVSTSYAIDH
ncbi:hypothetical protein DXG03_009602 [Asterophora parasitica]|uniref:Concentrative nucleoside transporter N-terminal domain-containing protein n=1 Tax=Asterophora parasitica TaxID=117018 RepID=A0A9P7GAQ0_9AGAR|nr:hypothetical protein DXG03_009602 [Asterophora parasitica]